jgi:hypothetical protein
MATPSGDHQIGFAREALQPAIVPGPDRIRGAAKHSRMRSAKGEEVRHEQLAEAHRLGKTDAPPNSGIVLTVVGG